MKSEERRQVKKKYISEELRIEKDSIIEFALNSDNRIQQLIAIIRDMTSSSKRDRG